MDFNDPIRALNTAVTFETADMTEPEQHAAWAWASFPSGNDKMGEVPMHTSVRPLLSKRQWDFGYRHHTELQTVFPIPGDHPEGGWLNTPKLVSREEYDEYWAVHSDTEAESAAFQAGAEALLGSLQPKLAERIEKMSPEQREAAKEMYRKQLPAGFERLAQAQAEYEKANGVPEQVAAQFDPAVHTVTEVLAYLDTADDSEKERVLVIEAAGRARKGITNKSKGEQ